MLSVYRGDLLHCLREPRDANDDTAVEFIADGLLLIEDGRIREATGDHSRLAELPPDTAIVDRRGKLLVPGFVDTHIHYVQTDIIASWGAQLLEWLETYTFPAEAKFADPDHARESSAFFVRELLRNGTTTALALGSVHAGSVDALFEAAAQRNMRLIAGKVLMDRNCPDYLQDTAESGYRESRKLLQQWHGHGRLGYAITPRFAPTSSEQQLQRAAELAAEFPDVWLHTHLAENEDEVAWVKSLYPNSRSYLDVYDQFDLLRPRSMYAHSIYLDDDDRSRLAETQSSVSFCPTCNLFIGSGLFDLDAATRAGVRVGLGTDVGGGTTFSMLQVINEAYKVMQLRGDNLSPWRAFYFATLGGARALHLDDFIGSFKPGKDADFLVLDPEATPLIARRTACAGSLSERVFAMLMLGDDRLIDETYLAGKCAHIR